MNNNKLRRAFIKALTLPPDSDVATLEYSKHQSWDSVAHMRLVSELESTFDVLLGSQDIIAMSSYAVAAEILSKHGVSFS